MRSDYIYYFSGFTDNKSLVKIVDQSKENMTYHLRVRVNDSEIVNTNTGALTPRLADLIDLLTAVFTADWLLPRSLEETKKILVRLPLREPKYFQQYSQYLQELLRWYTDDIWTFEFCNREARMRPSEQQPRLPFPEESCEVALWSGGLDAYAGVCNRIESKVSQSFTLVGSGSNTIVRGRQKIMADKVSEIYSLTKINFVQIPFDFEYETKLKPPQNQLFRARGFVFKLCGAICTLLQNQSSLHIYENGYGAFNLPFTQADIALAHTRSVHPISLIKTGDFVSSVVERPFRFENPFVFMTKGEMCQAITIHPEAAFNTSSCDSPRREKNRQCGQCSSCLLRRLSLIIAFGEDLTAYVEGQSLEGSASNHFRAMDIQAMRMKNIFNDEHPWRAWLSRYPEFRQWLPCLAQSYKKEMVEVQHNTLNLFHKHSQEWLNTRQFLM